MKPSQITDRYWHYAWAPPALRATTPRVGKWLLFIPDEALDEAWERIEAAVVAGRLGPAAKTRTASQGPPGESLKVICIYTRDADATADRERIRRAVAALGFTQELVYKTDEETLLGLETPRMVAASTWADGKMVRHLLPLRNDGGPALCGLRAGLHGWENQNHVVPDAYNPIYCRACLAALEK